MSAMALQRVGVVGAGRIGRRVIEALSAGAAGPWHLVAALVRRPAMHRGAAPLVTDDLASFLAAEPQLVLELAGPAALRELGPELLAAADVWSISGMALADAAFAQRLAEVAAHAGHRLRLLPGALGGLDVAAAAAVAPDARIALIVGAEGLADDAVPEFTGTAREVAQRYHGVNIIAALGLASVGLDAVQVIYHAAPPGSARQYTLLIESGFGRYRIVGGPAHSPATGSLLVSGSVIASLRQAGQPIWAG